MMPVRPTASAPTTTQAPRTASIGGA
jgi:hypothetical protein